MSNGEGKTGQGRTVLKRDQLMMLLLLCVCHRVQVMKIAIPLKKIQEKTPHARSVALGMSIARRNGFVVMGVTCGSTKSVQM